VSSRVTISDIKALLQERARALVPALIPDGAWQGAVWAARNPRRADKKRGSFVVWTTPPAIGAWKDYASGEHGDILDLIVFAKGLASRGDGLKWARDWLGLERIDPGEIRRARIAAKEREIQAEKDAGHEASRKVLSAFQWWLTCQPSLKGTVAERYLESRGIRLADLAYEPAALRFAPSLEHKPTATRWPGIVAAMVDKAGCFGAIHRTYLARDGRDKAPVEPNRMVWPSAKGLVIPLANGETALAPAEAARRGKGDRLALTEGLEDGLSVVLAAPELRVWAAVSLANLAAITLPACAREIIVLADNDWGKRQAEAQLERGLAALRAQGWPVLVARSHIGKDVNDLLRGAS
jgi:hypothetical protein